MNPRLSASLVLVSACSALPLAQAADQMTLPETQIQSTSTGALANSQSEGYQTRPASSTTRMGLTEKETLRSWTVLVTVLSVTGFFLVLLASRLLPLI